ncbi:zinc finger protein 462-like [Grus japonensis]|uniref:Zinc finger protein 462-like n=1 Tax=Grus japonensis TaxID=30415 RepID=A0ABC9WRP5_GRUJA
MPAGSKMDPPLAKAKPISTSVITYLRRKTKQLGELLQLERGVRRCKKLCRHPGGKSRLSSVSDLQYG